MQCLTTLAHRIGLKGSPLIQLLVSGLIGACAAPSSEPPYYEPPSSSEASVPLATVWGSLEQFVVDFDPYLVTNVCAYVFLIDGQRVKPDGTVGCTVAGTALLPGRHTVVALLAAHEFLSDYPQAYPRRSLAKTTLLLLDAVEGHSYKISVARVSSGDKFSARVWIHDETTQTPVTEAKLVISPGPGASDQNSPAAY